MFYNFIFDNIILLMSLSFLPSDIQDAIKKVNYTSLNEIRLRKNFPIKLVIDSKLFYLTPQGTSINKTQAIICTESCIDSIINTVTERSLYAHIERIKKGYLSYAGGVRIGIGGEYVVENGKVITVKNISSLNVRIPHEIEGCANDIYERLFKNGIKNILIISPPMQGKTTIIKELIKKISESNIGAILVIDERGEFLNANSENVDFISYADKLFSFEYGIRTLSPKVVIVDELISKCDWECVNKATSSGVKIIASCHAETIDELIKKDFFINNAFDNYIVLRSISGIASHKVIYDRNFKIL